MSVVGTWRQSHAEGVGGYLKYLGVGWAKRKLAEQFKPEASWAVVGGSLQQLLPTPLGTRLERFSVHEPVVESDPDGNEFVKDTKWEDGKLTTRARSKLKPHLPEFVTRRWIEDGKLVQVNEHGTASMRRVFHKVG